MEGRRKLETELDMRKVKKRNSKSASKEKETKKEDFLSELNRQLISGRIYSSPHFLTSLHCTGWGRVFSFLGGQAALEISGRRYERIMEEKKCLYRLDFVNFIDPLGPSP